MSQKIAVVDYGMGNLHSVVKALKYVSPRDLIQIADKPDQLNDAERVVFPGVGAIRDCMDVLRKTGMAAAIARNINEKPLLGICIGMQALYGANEEHTGAIGMGILNGKVKSLPHATANSEKLKIPHMGWNNIRFTPSPLWDKIEQDSRFYFLHSYYCETKDRSLSVAVCDYGTKFDAAIWKDNIFAVQFHPEKSHKNGLQLLANFIKWKGETH